MAMKIQRVLAALGCSLVLAVPAAAHMQPTVQVVANPQLGNILTAGEGRVLYRYTRDEGNNSTCYDQCAANWPSLVISSGEPMMAGGMMGGPLGTTTRRDGNRQVTRSGMPLYYFARDNAAGGANGQGLNNVWYVVEAAMP